MLHTRKKQLLRTAYDEVSSAVHLLYTELGVRFIDEESGKSSDRMTKLCQIDAESLHSGRLYSRTEAMLSLILLLEALLLQVNVNI